MKLILISTENNFDGELKILHQLFDLGLETFHLRKPNWNEKQIREYLEKIDENYLNRIVLHSFHELVSDFDLKGVHIKINVPLTHYSKLKTISISCHSIEEVEQTNELNLNYVFLSPIFDSISKHCYQSDYQKDELNTFLRNKKNIAIIALSGVDESRIDECNQLGFEGVAILGAVWESKNPVKSFIKIQEKCLQLEKIY